jgi:hypothetical protein
VRSVRWFDADGDPQAPGVLYAKQVIGATERAMERAAVVSTFSDYGEIGVVPDLFGLPEVAAIVSG